MERDRIFLSPREVFDAIRDDFNQYGAQVPLYLNLCPLVFGAGGWARDSRGRGVWILIGSRGKMHLVEYRQLGDRICTKLETADLTLAQLAGICRQVFRTRAWPGESGAIEGVRIETGMEPFDCIQCGQCCRNIGYPKEAEESDVARWRKAGREDILRWVGLKRPESNGCVYRIWITPGTNQPAAVCPWLEKQPGTHRYRCRIHEVKPDICRQYPGSRKHALMTGCQGFEKAV
ncbi:MAG: YkgJ family cysteine cluster protein [Desulfobacterales bacterium]|nr:YkgJ family cysteine cluster protein [Desulfobacterales bacterium]MCF8079621.1 YkgJ family cysteine cluster protein [Desulfobacterales bacterium]